MLVPLSIFPGLLVLWALLGFNQAVVVVLAGYFSWLVWYLLILGACRLFGWTGAKAAWFSAVSPVIATGLLYFVKIPGNGGFLGDFPAAALAFAPAYLIAMAVHSTF